MNIFMLGQDTHPVHFVREISKGDHGRAPYATPDNLRQYLFVDFLSKKMK